MSKDAAEIFAVVDRYRELILETERAVWRSPETGYRERRTGAYMERLFEGMGYTLTRAGDIPGFYTDIDTGRPGPKLLIMCELDSLIVANHPDCDPETHAVHACGHNAQCAAMAGIAGALTDPDLLSGLSGSIRLMVVPAEELIEVGYREELRAEGRIKYFGGKPEFMRRGHFDGVDLAFMVHTANLEEEGKRFAFTRGSNGCIAKSIAFKGVSAHAGGSPHEGVNALYMATQAISAINALRETFREEDFARVHPIITKGGNAVNAIPDDVRIESYVRGASMDAIIANNRKVNRAIAASAASIGGGVVIRDRPGYAPLINDDNLLHIAEEVMCEVAGRENVLPGYDDWDTGCTDMGDVSAVIPAIHPYAAGAVGNSHGSDYYIGDPVCACVDSAKMQVLLAARLLEEEAARAKSVLADFTPLYPSIADYLRCLDELSRDRDAVIYHDDGRITLDI